MGDGFCFLPPLSLPPGAIPEPPKSPTCARQCLLWPRRKSWAAVGAAPATAATAAAAAAAASAPLSRKEAETAAGAAKVKAVQKAAWLASVSRLAFGTIITFCRACWNQCWIHPVRHSAIDRCLSGSVVVQSPGTHSPLPSPRRSISLGWGRPRFSWPARGSVVTCATAKGTGR